MKNFFELKGKVIKSITGCDVYSECVVITTTDGCKVCLQHIQDCCENVSVVGFIGDQRSAIGCEIQSAEEDNPMEHHLYDSTDSDSYTITVFKLKTSKGAFEIVWVGESNGYYCENVDVSFFTPEAA